MHSIKYRIWSKELSKWVTDLSLENLADPLRDELNDIFLNDSLIFQLSLGKVDINGKEIYEGDILECLNRKINKYIRVIFDNTNAMFTFEDRSATDFFQFNEVIVAGNILENPELLK